jgi:hypothetical protein
MNIDEIKTLRRLIAALDERLAEWLDGEVAIEDAADMMLELNLAKRDLGFLYGTIEAKMSHLMKDGSDILALRDGAEMERKVASSRTKWRHAELANDVVDRVIQSSVDMDTGEVVLDAKGVAMKIMDYVQPSYWRATKLNEIGINPDNYCESELKTSIIVRKGNA